MLLRATLASALLLVACAPESFEGATRVVHVRDDLVATVTRVESAAGLTRSIQFDVEPDTASLLIQARGEGAMFALASLVTPEGRDLVEAGTVVTRSARGVPGEVAWLHPNGAGLVPEGSWRLIVRAEDASGAPWSGSVDIEILAKRTLDPGALCGLHLDVLVADDALHAADTDAALAGLTQRVNELLEPSGLTVLDYGVARLPDVDSRVELSGDPRAMFEVVRSGLAQLAESGLARQGTIRVMLVRSLGRGGTAGYALGLPGPFAAGGAATVGAAVLLSSESMVTDGFFDVERAATTLAHEIGHELGLYHTSESTGQQHDPLSDTPECAVAPCPAGFDENLMTPGGDPARETLTAEQAAVARRHPACEPTSRRFGEGE